MSPLRRRFPRWPQTGVTLIETLMVLSIASLIMAPILGWGILSLQQQGAVQERNADGASIGLLRTYFIRDVASADGAAAGAAAAGTDCSGGGGAAVDADDTVLRLDGEGATYIVYNETTSSDGEGLSIWRRECDGSTLLASAEIADRLAGGATIVTCGPRYGAPASDCGKVNFRVGTLAGEFVSMTATVRTGDAIAAPSGPVYVSPIVSISISPTVPVDGVVTVYRGEPITFDASGSSDPTGGTLTHLWNFGDGTTSTSAVVSNKTFTALGEFTAIYTATNSDGTPASDYVRIKVENRKPTAVISSPANGFSTNRCRNVTFGAAGSNDSGDPGGTIVEYRWDYGDGTTATKSSPANHTHQFATLSPSNGTSPLSVRLKVVDNDDAAYGNGVSTEVSRSVTVSNRPPGTPTISHGGGSGDITSNGPIEVEFEGDASDPDFCPGSDETLAYEWDWGDGSSDTTKDASHTFNNGGTYHVKLKVTDGSGATKTSSSLDVTINGIPTAAFAMSPSSRRVNVAFPSNWITNNSIDPDGDDMEANWSFPSGSPNSSDSWNPPPVSFTHNVGSSDTFTAATYNVVLTITDEYGAVSTTTKPVTITGAPAPTGLAKTGQRRVCVSSVFGVCLDYEYYNTFGWNAVAPPINGYQILIRYDDCTFSTCWVTTEHTTSGATSIEIKEHPAGGDDVYVRVRAREGSINKWGAWSPEVPVTLYG